MLVETLKCFKYLEIPEFSSGEISGILLSNVSETFLICFLVCLFVYGGGCVCVCQ